MGLQRVQVAAVVLTTVASAAASTVARMVSRTLAHPEAALTSLVAARTDRRLAAKVLLAPSMVLEVFSNRCPTGSRLCGSQIGTCVHSSAFKLVEMKAVKLVAAGLEGMGTLIEQMATAI